MSEIGFLIGNGLSRKDFDLHRLDGKGTVVGCNWIFRDYPAEYVVTLDSAITAQMRRWQDKPFKWIHRNERRAMCVDGVKVLERLFINNGRDNNSGIWAAAFLSKVEKCKKIYLIGVDFFRWSPSFTTERDGKVTNDLYCGLTRGHTIEQAWNCMFDQNKHVDWVRVGKIPEEEHEFFYKTIKGCRYIEEFDL